MRRRVERRAATRHQSVGTGRWASGGVIVVRGQARRGGPYLFWNDSGVLITPARTVRVAPADRYVVAPVPSTNSDSNWYAVPAATPAAKGTVSVTGRRSSPLPTRTRVGETTRRGRGYRP